MNKKPSKKRTRVEIAFDEDIERLRRAEVTVPRVPDNVRIVSSRPPLNIKQNEPLIFQNLDGDYITEDTSGAQNKLEEEAVIRLFGVTLNQNSVQVNIRGVIPYFYVPLPDGIDPTKDCDTLKLVVNVSFFFINISGSPYLLLGDRLGSDY
jgi:hypothetical protein